MNTSLTLPPGADAFTINDLTAITENRAVKPGRSNLFSIVWVQRGNGTCFADLGSHPLTDNTLYCFYPGMRVFLENVFGLQGYILSFTPDFLSPVKEGAGSILQSGLFNLCGMTAVPLCNDMRADIECWLMNIIKEHAGSTDQHAEVIRALLKILVIQLGRMRRTEIATINDEYNPQRDIDQVNVFLDLVHKHFLTKKKVADYAREMGLSPNYLNVKVKKVSGFSASYHIQQRILLEAKRQAKWEGMSLKEIAYTLGYDDLSHFSKFFKRTAGVNFSSYIRSSSVA